MPISGILWIEYNLVKNIKVTSFGDKTRIDRWLKRTFSSLNQAFIEKNLRKGFIKVKNKKGQEKTNKILFELSPVIDSGLDNLPIPEKCYDEKISCDESGNNILLTFKRY